ncbi:MAG: Six-hairpin glycosidase-like protein [Linnemannia gamsii]|nr:MAG: Six-hairpin glycosidase-like protein [Linnemannia gamsii]
MKKKAFPAPGDSSAERKRLKESDAKKKHWMRWGPYLSERQWATVREDYSADGDAWRFFPHDHARSRTYRWGEDGLAGVSDNHQRFCVSLALWNGKDKILKERLYGLTNHEGNHGEDVKELYYYLDNTPTHSYMKYLYKYPQAPFPYDQLVEENVKRSRIEPEYELIDTGIFNDNKYFDVFIEYAKDGQDEDDVLIKITAHNRGAQEAPVHIIPQFWFRNTWSWFPEGEVKIPSIVKKGDLVLEADHDSLGKRWVHFEAIAGAGPDLIFTNNETNQKKLFNNPNICTHVKDAFHEYVVQGNQAAVNKQDNKGTKAAGVYKFEKVPAGGKVEVRVRLNKKPPGAAGKGQPAPGVVSADFERVLKDRIKEADDFYSQLALKGLDNDLSLIQRQALAGMLWSKQFYHFDQRAWRKGDPIGQPPPPERMNLRNKEWKHMYVDDILSMPDKWEYPFFAAWDMAFHTIPLSLVDPTFAKKQLDLLTREWYMHPSGQIPAYEWNFSDVNPPVHAWATLQVFKTEERLYGNADRLFLERVFQKLLLNFTWWVNRKDTEGNNVFEGGFLGLDNIGLFNRSEPLPNGATLRQADGTSWMAFFSLCMLHIALELAKKNEAYEDIASKFLEHFFHISDAMTYHSGSEEKSLWDSGDKFFYDSISWPGGHTQRLKTRSLVGLIPLFSTLALDPEYVDLFPGFKKRLDWLLAYREKHRPARVFKKEDTKENKSILLALVDQTMLRAVLTRLLDENEFLSPYGIRSLSKYHKDHPLSMWVNGQEFKVDYLPAESDSGMFGGNSNWRGPIWLPTTYLLVNSLKRFHYFYGPDFKVECPTGSGIMKNLEEVAWEIEIRLIRLVYRNKQGQRAANGGNEKTDQDPLFKDLVLSYEYFDAESGKGLGASHQTGWTGLLAVLVHQVGSKCQSS